MKLIIVCLSILMLFLMSVAPALAVVDPRDKQNNIVGVGILSPEAEIEEASGMVNSNGDWGWILVVIKKSERDVDRWQNIFNLANKHHLIPIVRIATEFDNSGSWAKPSGDDHNDWADFLSKLYWPTKNKYVQVYNEVNRSTEWGGNVDASSYAKELERTIAALREKSSDFFIMAAPLDLALTTGENSLDAAVYFQTMNSASPGIFGRIDGLASHSYPNPDFSASPLKTGRLSIRGYEWELEEVAKYGARDDLPVFITETGWRRATDITSGLDEQTIADYYKIAFEQVWTQDKRIVAVTPFVLNYPDSIFQPFSFSGKKILGEKFFSYYFTVRDLPKVKGEPARENIASEPGLDLSRVLIKDLNEKGKIIVKNLGNYIWVPKLEVVGAGIEAHSIKWSGDNIYPGQEATVTFRVKSTQIGDLPVKFFIFDGNELVGQQEIVARSETFLSRLMDVFKKFLS